MPAELRKLDAFMPRRCASRFIICAKLSSLPAMASDSATQASLPDWTIIPLIRSSTFTCVSTWMNIREPCAFQAFSETVIIWSSWIVPCLSAAEVR